MWFDFYELMGGHHLHRSSSVAHDARPTVSRGCRHARRTARSSKYARLRFERLEARLALDASSLCAPPAEAVESPPASDARVEESREHDRDCSNRRSSDVNEDGQVTATDAKVVIEALNESSADNLRSDGAEAGDVSGNGEVTAADALMILNDATLGGEGEYGSFAEGESSADVSALLGQMLDFVTDEAAQDLRPNSTAATAPGSIALFESGLISPELDERLRGIADQDISRSMPAAIDDGTQRSAPGFVRGPATRSGAVRVNMALEEDMDIPAFKPLVVESVDRSSGNEVDTPSPEDADKQPTQANFSRRDVDLGMRAELITARTPSTPPASEPVERGKADTEIRDNDLAFMSYLRQAEWAFAPVAAGLAYALTQSLDRGGEPPQPKTMSLKPRRNRRRLP